MSVIFSYYFDDLNVKQYSKIMTSEVYVGRMVTEDLYLSGVDESNDEIIIVAKIIPLVSFLWIGMALFIIGIILRIITDMARTNHKKHIRHTMHTKKIGSRTGKRVKRDYEQELENELKKLRG